MKVVNDLTTIERPTEDASRAIAMMDPQLRHMMITSAQERPAGKIVLSGKTDFLSYNYLLELNENNWRQNMKHLF